VTTPIVAANPDKEEIVNHRVSIVAALAAATLITATAAASPSPAPAVQFVALAAMFDHAGTSGGPPDKLGHRQFGDGHLRTIEGKNVGTFAVNCRWFQILRNDDANEHCTGSATTSDGHVTFAGPSRRSALTHTWSLISGTGGYAGAHGTLTVRDIGPNESIAAMRITPRTGVVIRAGVVSQPAADARFRARVATLCTAAGAQLSRLPRFPFHNFDPLSRDPKVLPKLGRFLAGRGDARPVLVRLVARLRALGAPPAARPVWDDMLSAERSSLAARNAQVRAALRADVLAFIASVHRVGATMGAVALAATAFGSDACIIG
jgi:hypothetical protein